jgi:hypothetical protein
MRVRITVPDILDIEVEHHGAYAPDLMAELVTHAFTLYGWVRDGEDEDDLAEDEP